MSNPQSPLRLRKKHSGDGPVRSTAIDGQRLLEIQSIRNAVIAGLLTVLVFSALWVSLTALLDRVFPWFTVVLGFLLGFAIRVAGRGVDWRFPLLAALLAIGGALFANVVVAASTTADEFGVSTVQILQSVTFMTWPVFFNEVLTAADAFFAVVGGGIAAFYANRKLSRSQFYALRLWQEELDD